MDELVKDLTLDMISEGLYRMIAEAIGTDNFYKLAEIVGGTTIYTSPARPSPLTEQNISVDFSPEAVTKETGTTTQEEPRPTTSGTGSSLARRSSPASRLRSPPTWTQTRTRPT